VDAMLLEALGSKLSAELDRYDADVLDSQERRMMAQLQDYVPVRVAEEIQRGSNVELGNVEISILFVDMRNYSTISSALSDEEIFELTSEYTAAVSEAIENRGGVVVEFQGDGLMAVFGAPTQLDGKETLAVAAAHDANKAVSSERFMRFGHGQLRVGVGIATGTAFVGTIQSAGQKVWSAMGNNVNLAARLEGLTKALDASVVVDAATFARLEQGASLFHLEEAITVKGRDAPVDVYYIPGGG
jgi:adenylate cyclase